MRGAYQCSRASLPWGQTTLQVRGAKNLLQWQNCRPTPPPCIKYIKVGVREVGVLCTDHGSKCNVPRRCRPARANIFTSASSFQMYIIWDCVFIVCNVYISLQLFAHINKRVQLTDRIKSCAIQLFISDSQPKDVAAASSRPALEEG